MRSSLIILFFLISNIKNSIANQTPDTLPEINEIGFMMGCIEIPAKPNFNEWASYLQNKLVLDDSSLSLIPPACYTVIIQFVIDKEGKIRDVSIWKDPGYGLGQRAAQAVSNYPGKWEPATLNGRLIKSYRKQPITFLVEKEDEKCKEPLPANLIL